MKTILLMVVALFLVTGCFEDEEEDCPVICFEKVETDDGEEFLQPVCRDE